MNTPDFITLHYVQTGQEILLRSDRIATVVSMTREGSTCSRIERIGDKKPIFVREDVTEIRRMLNAEPSDTDFSYNL